MNNLAINAVSAFFRLYFTCGESAVTQAGVRAISVIVLISLLYQYEYNNDLIFFHFTCNLPSD